MKVRRPFVQKWNGRELLYCSLGTISEDFPDIREFAEQNSHEHWWKTGDILIWDNMRMMHKRDSFKGEGGSFMIGPNAFGHVGFGGSSATFADPDCKMSFGYLVNKLGGEYLISKRGQSLINASYNSIK